MLRSIGRTNHDTSSVYKISCNMCEKHFFEGSRGQEAQRHVEWPCGEKHFFEGSRGQEAPFGILNS